MDVPHKAPDLALDALDSGEVSVILEEALELEDEMIALLATSRDTHVGGKHERENLLEHHAQVMYFAWFVGAWGSRKGCLPADIDMHRVCMYAMIHDWVELPPGRDTPAFRAPPHERAEKKVLEQRSFERIRRDWAATFPELVGAIEAYRRQDDVESRLVRALDKLVSVIVIWRDHGREWREQGLDFERYKREMLIGKVLSDVTNGHAELAFIEKFAMYLFEQLEARALHLFASTPIHSVEDGP